MLTGYQWRVKINVLFLSAILLSTLTSAIKPLKDKLLVHLCESINGNLGEREVMCYSRVVPLEKKAERDRALLKRKGKQSSSLGPSEKEGKDCEAASLGLRHASEGLTVESVLWFTAVLAHALKFQEEKKAFEAMSSSCPRKQGSSTMHMESTLQPWQTSCLGNDFLTSAKDLEMETSCVNMCKC